MKQSQALGEPVDALEQRLMLTNATPTVAVGEHALVAGPTFLGDSAGDQFGRSVSAAGDVNGDGFADVIVGSQYDDGNGTDSGSATVFSGADNSVIHTMNGAAAGDRFGFSISGAGDVNGDGFDDIIVGAVDNGANGVEAGSATVFSGIDGTVLYTVFGDAADDALGASVSGAGDVNNDGFADFLVGAPKNDTAGSDAGLARILSGADGSVLDTIFGDAADDRFGQSVAGSGDVNGDGFADIIVGANGNGPGFARIFSGANSDTLFTFQGDTSGDNFGRTVSPAGDINNDGFADVIVGAPFDDNNGNDSGSATVFSGSNGDVLYTFDGNANDRLGLSVDGGGDVNGDGFDDLVVGVTLSDAGGTNSGGVRIYSGRNGSLLQSFVGLQPLDVFGNAVAIAGDTNGDGFADVIVGAYHSDQNGSQAGSAQLFVTQPKQPVERTVFGDSAGDRLGRSVSDAGDVNGDGFDDYIVGAIYDDNYGAASGSARVISGADGNSLWTFHGDLANDRFGSRLAALAT